MASTAGTKRRNLVVLSGALFVLLWLAGTIVPGFMVEGSYPQPKDGPKVVQEFFQDSADGVELGAGLQLPAAVALLLFAGVMASFLRSRGRQDATATTVVASGAVAAATLMVSCAATLSITGSDVTSDAYVTQALSHLSFWTGGPLHVAALGLMILALAYGLTDDLAKWLRIAGLVVGAAGVVSVLTAVIPPAVIFTPIGRFLGLIWLLIVTISLSLRRSSEPA